MTTPIWTEKQVRKFAKDLKIQWAGVWPHLTFPLQSAIVEAGTLSIIMGLREDRPITSEDAVLLLVDMERAMGLRD